MIGEWQIPDHLDAATRDKLLRLDALIRQLDQPMDTLQGLMREHLTQARSYLADVMPEEYKITLDLAKENLPGIDPPELRARIGEFLKQS